MLVNQKKIVYFEKMRNKARDYTRTTVRRLDTLSNNQCANPDCDRKLIAIDGETIISKICHIEAASANGPRFNPDMIDDERRHYYNLILLCDECHSIIDNKENEDNYPVKLLKDWKDNHANLIQQNLLIQKPQLLNQAINAIADLYFADDKGKGSESINSFEISEKITHNNIKRNKSLIEEYCKYYGKINSLYAELENAGSFKKEKLLRNIKLIYTRVKGQYLSDSTDELQLIQSNADNIIEAIEEKLIEGITANQSSTDEDISFSLPMIMVDAFMRCKILEEPPK